ncbi:TolB family protein [Brevibacillus daliensis]|uniref:TolB family protein n=1 Tax=Brevibacillus daliensis TaxID=2892995 RepID=UPI001E3E5A07|nr:hypothetical protein [Brevibacillus daliensis]
MMDDQRRTPDEKEETVVELLAHLNEMRRAVPVNYRLKEDLKRKLMEQMQDTKQSLVLDHTKLGESKQVDKELKKNRGRLFTYTMAGAVALVAITYLVWPNKDLSYALPSDASSVPLLQSKDMAAINSSNNEKKIAFVDQDQKVQVKTIQLDREILSFSLPKTAGSYEDVAWSDSGTSMAVTEELEDKARLWVINLGNANRAKPASRLVLEVPKAELLSPSFAPNSDLVAYTRVQNGKQEIWVTNLISLEEEKLTDGTDPAWSSDGRYLSYIFKDEIKVYDRKTEEHKTIGKGSAASWFSSHHLLALTPEKNISYTDITKDNPSWKNISIPREVDQSKLTNVESTGDGSAILLVTNESNGYQFTPLDLEK